MVDTNPKLDDEFDPDFYNIPRSRWDCKLLEFFDAVPIGDFDFCMWWRRVAMSVLVCLFLVYVAIGFVFVPYAILTDISMEDPSILLSLLVIPGTLSWMFVAVVLLIICVVGSVHGLKWVAEKCFAKDYDSEPKPPGLVKQKYIAWKQKVCPKSRIVDK